MTGLLKCVYESLKIKSLMELECNALTLKGIKTPERMFRLTHGATSNQNHSEMSPHTCQNGSYQNKN